MKARKIRITGIITFCIMALLMIFACKKPEGANIEKASSGAENAIIAGYDAEAEKAVEEFKPEYDTCLFPIDFERLGLMDMVSLSEVIGKVPEEILLKTTKININMSSVKSFKGIERFENLQFLELFNLELNDLTEISLHKPLEWLTINNSVINDMRGLSNLQELYLLSLNGSKIVNWEGFDIPESVKILSLSKFMQYREATERMSDTVEQLYLEGNNISSLSEIKFLQKKLNLQVLYIKENNIPQVELIENTPYWGKIELIWFLA